MCRIVCDAGSEFSPRGGSRRPWSTHSADRIAAHIVLRFLKCLQLRRLAEFDISSGTASHQMQDENSFPNEFFLVSGFEANIMDPDEFSKMIRLEDDGRGNYDRNCKKQIAKDRVSQWQVLQKIR